MNNESTIPQGQASAHVQSSPARQRFPWPLPGRRTLIISVVLTILLLVLDNTFAISDKILSVVSPPRTVTPTLATNAFYFQTLPAWGTVAIDGHTLAQLPVMSTDAPITLVNGTHHIVWQTAPFYTMDCQLVVPVTTSTAQSCPTQALTNPNVYTPSALLVTPPQAFSLRLLPAAQQQALIQTVQTLLDSQQATDTVQEGERYVDNQDTTERATQKLQASLRFLLDTTTSTPARCQGITLGSANDAPCAINRHDCRLFCTVTWGDSTATSTQPHWDVAAIIHPIRTYTAQGMQESIQEVTGTEQFATFRIRWLQDHWQVAFHQQGDSSFDDPNCMTLMNILLTQPRYQSPGQTHWSFVSAANRAQGCVAATQPDDLSQPLAASQIVLLQRFDVLLAASQDAATHWPQLPAATADEQRIAQAILQKPAFVS